MQAQTIREDQAQFLLAEIEKSYRAFGQPPRWMGPEGRAELREHLATSTQRAQSAIATMDAQPGLSGELKVLRSKLAVLSTMAEADLNPSRQRYW